jgi:putative phosphoribosyl transferase
MGMTSGADAGTDDASVTIEADGAALQGTLRVPAQACGVVLFAHGSGSSRHSPRNRMVAERLSTAGLATLLMDLLTAEEEVEDERTRALRFDVELLARRLVAATDWLEAQPPTQHLPAGYFGASTGAGAALMAAAARPEVVYAVVSRGGRPDLAGHALHHVRAATLLIVGGNDPVVYELNRAALGQLGTAARLEVIPGATHLFAEAGALEQVAVLARDWFLTHLLPHDPLPADFRTSRGTPPRH